MIQNEIIALLSQPVDMSAKRYSNLKYCLKPLKHPESVLELADFQSQVDYWFQGVINSLYGRPNQYVLVLEGGQAIGKTEFFRRLLPERQPYGIRHMRYTDRDESIYNDLIMHKEFTRSDLTLPLQSNFFIPDPPTAVYKRLASYCSTTNKWRFPKRKNIIVMPLESIDQELYNSINKLELWKEIFQIFKP